MGVKVILTLNFFSKDLSLQLTAHLKTKRNSSSTSYVTFVQEHNPEAVIVFDGYVSGHSIKDMTHLRRSKGIKGTPVHFSTQMSLQSSKEQFLENTENKQRFLLALWLACKNTVIHS